MNKEEELQNALITTFLANLSFLHEYDNELFERIDGLSKLIEKNEYKERYRLEFDKEEGDFDIYDIEHNVFLYNKQSKKYNSKALSSVNFDTKGSFSILEPYYFRDNNKIGINEKSSIFDVSGSKLIDDINEFKDILNDNLSNFKKQKLKKIEKFIFIGTLLGRHIPLILEKTHAKNFFICENNIEIFRLSLFVVDYSNLARDGRTVVFSIMEENYKFNHKCGIFLRNNYHQNYMIKYYATDHNLTNSFDNIMDSLTSEKSIAFNHYMMLDNVAKLTLERKNKYNILSRKIAKEKDLLIKNKPVLYVCAGPSLSDAIEWIFEHQDKFIIVAIGASTQKLISANIIPDIICTLDPKFEEIDKSHFDDDSIKILSNTIVFASMNTDQRILNKFDKNNLFLYEIIHSLDFEEKLENGCSVGEIIGTLLLNLGVTQLYLIGLDLALNQETGKSHIIEYEHGTSYNLKELISSMDKNYFSLREDIIQVKGNLKRDVYTTRLFNTSLNAFSKSCKYIKSEKQFIYNLSNNGAYIENTIPKKIKDIEINAFEKLNKEMIFADLIKDFKKISNVESKDINNFLLDEKKYLLGIKEFIEDDLIMPINCFDDFSKRYLLIEKALLSPDIKTTFMTIIFAFYFQSIMPYLYYHFNNNKIKKENIKVRKINQVFNRQLIILIDRYISYIENKKG